MVYVRKQVGAMYQKIYELKEEGHKEFLVICKQWADSLMKQEALVIGFEGDLGAGKTFFIRNILRSAGCDEEIKSPTFSLLETYNVGSQSFHHIDCYRLSSIEQLTLIGFDLYGKGIALIEWSNRIEDLRNCLDILVTITDEGFRQYCCIALSPKGHDFISSMP